MLLISPLRGSIFSDLKKHNFSPFSLSFHRNLNQKLFKIPVEIPTERQTVSYDFSSKTTDCFVASLHFAPRNDGSKKRTHKTASSYFSIFNFLLTLHRLNQNLKIDRFI